MLKQFRLTRRAVRSGSIILIAALLTLPSASDARSHKHAKHHHKHSKLRRHAKSHVLPTVGNGEGRLDLLVWPGYAEDAWVKPFEQNTRCTVVPHYARSSQEMVDSMRLGGHGAIDLVSAPADVTQDLIDRREVKPIDVTLIPAWRDFFQRLKSPAFNTVKGVHWGLSYEWGANTLMWNSARIKHAPPGWAAIYDPKYANHIALPDNFFQIADAALYLSKTQPSLKITDPFELDAKQMAAVVSLLQTQRPLIRRYWTLAAQEITQFKSGRSWIGVGGPYQTVTLKTAGVPVVETVPAEGATAWADSWMLAARAGHTNCAYLWMQWTATPQVQSAQALYFGETPANSKACTAMDALKSGSCRRYHADGSGLARVRFQKTPQTRCAQGKNACADLAAWRAAWEKIKE